MYSILQYLAKVNLKYLHNVNILHRPGTEPQKVIAFSPQYELKDLVVLWETY